MSFKDLKLGTKQAIGFGVILVMMAAVNIYAINRMSVLRDELEEVTHIWLRQAITISNISGNIWNLRLAQLYHAFAEDEAQKQERIDEIVGLLNEIIRDGEVWDSLQAVAGARGMESNPEAMTFYDRYDESFETYQDLSFGFLDLEAPEQRRQALNLLQGTQDNLFDTLTTALAQLVALTEDDALAAAARAEQTFLRTRRVIRTLLLVTIGISVAMAWVLVGFITGPVRQLVIAAGSVSQGDLDVQLDVKGKDEMGHLAQSFNKMTAALRSSTEKTQYQAAQLRMQSEELRENYLELEEKSASLAEHQVQTEAKNRALEAALKQLKAAQQQLILREKMASLGQLTAGIAHEIKNPLNFVNNFARLTNDLVVELEEGLADQRQRLDEAGLSHVEDVLADLKFNAAKIQEHGKRADGIVRSMLDHSRSAPGERRPIDLNALLEEYVNLTYHGMRARYPDFNVQIDRSYGEAVGEVMVVPQEVGRVFLNLLDNAFYAVYARKSSAEAGYEPTVSVSSERRNGDVCITIRDNGGGIAEEVTSRIFEPFFTTKPTGSGTGLGLYLSYEIITQGHGGSLKFDNTPGEGVGFMITLPAA